MSKFVLNTILLLAIAPVASADNCSQAGYYEMLVEPAKTEDGFVRVTQYSFSGAEQWMHKAKYEIMTLEAYNALEKDMTYETYSWEAAKISKTKIEPQTNIADYDLVRTIDGNSFYRPLEKPVNQRVIETHEMEIPGRRKITVNTLKRPEPEILGEGRLKVMISPQHYETRPSRGEKNGVWRGYIKSRTPAVYQQVECNEED